MKKKFIALRDFLTGKPYTHHLVTPFFAVENNMPFGEDDEVIICLLGRMTGNNMPFGED